jgi:hypothetical protein
VGFLFPHPCTRTNPDGCPDCNGGSIQDPFRQRNDRYGYSEGFDSYSATDYSSPSSASFTGPAFGGGDSGGGGASADFGSDFTEADGESLTQEGDFEDDASAS